MLRFPRRAGAADRDAAQAVIDAEQREFEPPRARAAAFKMFFEPAGEAGERGLDVGGRDERLDKTRFDGVIGRRRDRRDRLLLCAEGLVETPEEKRTEAGSERRAGEVVKLADALEAETPQTVRTRFIEPQRLDRQRRKKRPRIALRRDSAGKSESRGKARAGRCGDCGARRDSRAGKAGEKVVDEGLFAAEKMRGAGNVENRRAGFLDPDKGRVAQKRECKFTKSAAVARGVGRRRLKAGKDRARLGERLAGIDPARLRKPVASKDPQRILRLLIKNERLFRRRGALQPVRRK